MALLVYKLQTVKTRGTKEPGGTGHQGIKAFAKLQHSGKKNKTKQNTHLDKHLDLRKE